MSTETPQPLSTKSPTSGRIIRWSGIGLVLAAVVLVGATMAAQLVTLNQRNHQLTMALSAAQTQNAKLVADSQKVSTSDAGLSIQNADLQQQVAKLKSQLGSVLADERVGRASFESLIGLLNGSHYAATCSSAVFDTTALRQQCASVESYYDQIDAIALPYLGN
jgi:hypothetical protein